LADIGQGIRGRQVCTGAEKIQSSGANATKPFIPFVSDVVATKLESLGLTFSQVCLIFASKSGALFYPILPYFTCNHKTSLKKLSVSITLAFMHQQ
jgi:hypothetical protein